ncbi:hypothetical protein ACXIZN_41550 [Amycolatopsis sp. TRM77291]
MRCLGEASEAATTWFPFVTSDSSSSANPRIWWSLVRVDRPLLAYQQVVRANKLRCAEHAVSNDDAQAVMTRSSTVMSLINAEGDVLSHSGDLVDCGSEEGSLATLVRCVMTGVLTIAEGI